MNLMKEIKLDYAIIVEGEKVDKLTMRRPKTGDVRDSALYSNVNAAMEVHLFSKLCGLSLTEMEAVDYADYGDLQDAYVEMTTKKSEPSSPESGKTSAE